MLQEEGSYQSCLCVCQGERFNGTMRMRRVMYRVVQRYPCGVELFSALSQKFSRGVRLKKSVGS